MGCAHSPCEEKKKKLLSSCCTQVWPKQFTLIDTHTHSHYFLMDTPKEIKIDDGGGEEEEMGEGRGMGRPSA